MYNLPRHFDTPMKKNKARNKSTYAIWHRYENIQIQVNSPESSNVKSPSVLFMRVRFKFVASFMFVAFRTSANFTIFITLTLGVANVQFQWARWQWKFTMSHLVLANGSKCSPYLLLSYSQSNLVIRYYITVTKDPLKYLI